MSFLKKCIPSRVQITLAGLLLLSALALIFGVFGHFSWQSYLITVGSAGFALWLSLQGVLHYLEGHIQASAPLHGRLLVGTINMAVFLLMVTFLPLVLLFEFLGSIMEPKPAIAMLVVLGVAGLLQAVRLVPPLWSDIRSKWKEYHSSVAALRS